MTVGDLILALRAYEDSTPVFVNSFYDDFEVIYHEDEGNGSWITLRKKLTQ